MNVRGALRKGIRLASKFQAWGLSFFRLIRAFVKLVKPIPTVEKLRAFAV